MEPPFILGAEPAMTLREFMEEMCQSVPDVEVVLPTDGLCARTDCGAPATQTTLIGLPFCDKHFSEFYTADR